MTDPVSFQDKEYATRGFAGYDPINNLIVIAFRGSKPFINWW